MKNIIICSLVIYVAQALICSIINMSNSTRIPRGMLDFIKLTTLPYLIFNLKKVREK